MLRGARASDERADATIFQILTALALTIFCTTTDLTLRPVAKGPDWMALAPQRAWWSDDGGTVFFFRWSEDGVTSQIVRIDLGTGKPLLLPRSMRPLSTMAAGRGGDVSSDVPAGRVG